MCKGDEDMVKKATINYPDITETRKPKIVKALKEVEMIASGKLSGKSAREFLSEPRNQ